MGIIEQKVKNPGIIKASIFALIPFIFLLCAGEAFCRIKLYFQTKDSKYLTSPFFLKGDVKENSEYRFKINNFYGQERSVLYFKLVPGEYMPDSRFGYGHYTVNSLGFRGKEFKPYNKDEATIRIFCIGESSTFGAESPDNKTWPAQLESYLSEGSGKKFEVINSGFPSYYSSNYLNLIKSELLSFKPDMFILYSGVNELYKINQDSSINKTLENIHRSLYYRWSLLYTLLNEKFSILTQKQAIPVNLHNWKRAKKEYLCDIEEIIELCKNRQIRIIVVRQLLYTDENLFKGDNLTFEKIIEIQADKHKDSFGNSYANNLEIFHHNELMILLQDLSLKEGIRFLDYRKDFYSFIKEDKMIFFDSVHLTSEGNSLLAKLISQDIKAHLEKTK